MPYPLREGEDEAAKEDEIDEAVALSPEDEAEGSQNMLVALWCKVKQVAWVAVACDPPSQMRFIPPTVLAVSMLLLGTSRGEERLEGFHELACQGSRSQDRRTCFNRLLTRCCQRAGRSRSGFNGR